MTSTQHADYCDGYHKSGKYLCSEEKDWRENKCTLALCRENPNLACEKCKEL